MLESIIGPLKTWATSIIYSLGYQGLFLMMLLDSLNIPIPSEVIMPTGGMLASEGKLNYWLVGLAGGFGTLLGSIINYGIGAKLGKEGLIKYGKYILIRPKDVQQGEVWFEKHGAGVTLWGRFIPLVRTFISLPAGIYRMNFPLFVLFAVLGAFPWCFGWAYVGYQMQEHWDSIQKYWKYLDYVVILAVLALLTKWLISRRRDKATSAT